MMTVTDRFLPSLWASATVLAVIGLMFSRPTFAVLGAKLLPSPTATVFERLATSLPPSNRLAHRAAAIAVALRTGERTYAYTMDQLPMLGPDHSNVGSLSP